MIFYLIGIDYKTAPLSVREAVVLKQKDLINRLDTVAKGTYAVLVTCNRIEIYGTVPYYNQTQKVLELLAHEFREFYKYSYLVYGYKYIYRHLLRLACGLESQLLGETQIAQQLLKWKTTNSLPEVLDTILDEVLHLSYKIRNGLGLNVDKLSIVDMVMEDLIDNGILKYNLKTVIVGTGCLARLVAEKLNKYGQLIFVSRKNKRRAKEFSDAFGASLIDYLDLPKVGKDADILISVTSSPHPVIKSKYLPSYCGEKPLYIYDLALPRNVDADIAKRDDIVLKNMDGLNVYFKRYQNRSRGKLALVEEEIEKYLYLEGDNYEIEGRDTSQQVSVTAG